MVEPPPTDAIASAPHPTDRLFFAVYPDAVAAARIAALAERLRRELGLKGRPIALERVHVTLCFLGNHVGVPAPMVEAASAAASSIHRECFEVAFDRAASLPGGPGVLPFVLLGGEGVSPVKRLQLELHAALATPGLAREGERPYVPHVTLLYDARAVAEIAVETVAWTVREFVLVHSPIGQGKHVTLGRWPLRDRGARAVR